MMRERLCHRHCPYRYRLRIVNIVIIVSIRKDASLQKSHDQNHAKNINFIVSKPSIALTHPLQTCQTATDRYRQKSRTQGDDDSQSCTLLGR